MIMLITIIFIILLPLTAAAIFGGMENSSGFHIPSETAGKNDYSASLYGSSQRTQACGNQEMEALSGRLKGNEAS